MTDGKEPAKSLKETVFSFTPVALTVIATVLAGLSSSEMTRSQYFRALASQNQSKASDQWAFYQAKRGRAVEASNTIDLLTATSHPTALDKNRLLAAADEVTATVIADAKLHDQAVDLGKELRLQFSAMDAQELMLMNFSSLTSNMGSTINSLTTDALINSKAILDAMKAVDTQQTEAQMAPLLRQITDDDMDVATQTANGNLTAYDAAVGRTASILDGLHSATVGLAAVWAEFSRTTPAPGAAIQGAQADVAAARLRFASARYEREAGYNLNIARLYEVQVHRRGVESDRHKSRSAGFFYGMLAAQAGVMVASFSLAVRRKSTFWTLAAIAGAAAVGMSGYVYLFI